LGQEADPNAQPPLEKVTGTETRLRKADKELNEAWNQRQNADKELNQNNDESMVYDLVNNLRDKVLNVLEKEVARARIQAF
jgi:hypothetical protein